jgi:hypothetical protein
VAFLAQSPEKQFQHSPFIFHNQQLHTRLRALPNNIRVNRECAECIESEKTLTIL